ncbi:MAG: carboxyltransferase domain-containing protein [Methylocystis sp.]|uniref:5-oxoprolinase subunit B/C family protein n=1 Tax=Methylocystis sp. TaxID=1911079 RepID=UPI003DA5E53C
MSDDTPRFLDQGETALTVEFGDAVDPALNARVLALDAAFRAGAPAGVKETTPTYRSLLVRYEPLEISRDALVAWITPRLSPGAAAEPRADAGAWVVPCCYDPAVAEDIGEAAARLGLDARDLVAAHAAADYRAYMYGFAPGWCYLGGLPRRLTLPRRLAPRGPTPEGAVLIGGGLSLIGANPMPTGWYVIGRTPERLFSLRRDPPFLIAPGDALRFEPIDAATFAALDARAAAGEMVMRREPPPCPSPARAGEGTLASSVLCPDPRLLPLPRSGGGVRRGPSTTSPRLHIHAAGPGVTVQDAGRFGFSRFGVTPAGPMDREAFLTATRAVGASAALEISLGGLEVSAEGATLAVALAGGNFTIRLDGRELPPACLIPLEPGARLTVRAGAAGAWCYAALGGRLDLPPALGSLSTHARSGIGPKPLAAGESLFIADAHPAPHGPHALAAPWLARAGAPIRVTLGPQEDHFSPEALQTFLSAAWRVGARSDRMAYALEGPRLSHARGHDIVSDGAVMGAVQVPGSGAPFVLMADRQPTGGYPKIATVIGADLGRVAQARPGETLRFRAVDWAEAVAARAALEKEMAAGAVATPLAAELSTETLLAANLIGGVVSARD